MINNTTMKTIDWEAINREWEIDELIRRNHSFLYPTEVEETDDDETVEMD